MKLFVIIALLASSTAFAADTAGSAFFEQKIRPVLVEHCYSCHSAEAQKVKGNLYLDSKAGWQKGGDSGAAVIVPGKPDESLLIRTVRHLEVDTEMPPKKQKLPDSIIADLVTWVQMGAPDPRDGAKVEAKRGDKSWWSLQPLAREFKFDNIDGFIKAKLAEKKLTLNPPADARNLIRRMTYDVIGLPPTPDEVSAFEKAHQANPHQAVADLADRLLASPCYGERWGRHWLDVVRFGESNGFERNFVIDDLWPFRDYVIDSINADKPFKQFISEHLAGDVIGKDNPKVEVGSAFLVAGPYDDVGNQDVVAQKNIRAATLDDIITATSGAFLGLTINCARCHNHKFDPIPTEDYYRLRSAFEGVIHGRRVIATKKDRDAHSASINTLNQQKTVLTGQLEALKKAIAERTKAELATGKTAGATPDEQQKQTALTQQIAQTQQKINAIPRLPEVWAGTYIQPNAPTFVHKGGDPMKPGDSVVPASLNVLDRVTKPFALKVDAPESERRLALATWITSDDNPLTPRVLVNRLWQHHFGTGIVDTPSDFGFLGSKPTHPELLDFLADKLIKNGWKIKALHREILLSETYLQSAAYREDAAKEDKDARLLWRFPPRRLSAEELRDSILTAAGKLQLAPMGGPGFRLYKFFQNNVCTYTPLDHHGSETYRRAIYHQNARASVVDVLNDFDLPDIAFAAPKRANTTTPLQALTLLNHSFTLDMAKALAARVKDSDSIASAYFLVFQRPPTVKESEAANKLIKAFGLEAFCRALLNSNEFIYIE